MVMPVSSQHDKLNNNEIKERFALCSVFWSMFGKNINQRKQTSQKVHVNFEVNNIHVHYLHEITSKAMPPTLDKFIIV